MNVVHVLPEDEPPHETSHDCWCVPTQTGGNGLQSTLYYHHWDRSDNDYDAGG